MNGDKYIQDIENRLEAYYDIKRPYTYQGVEFDLFAESFVRNEKFLASRKLTIYAFENNEHVFVKKYKNLNDIDLERFTGFLEKATEDYVNPGDEHMSTVITGLIVVEEEIGRELVRDIKKYKYMKNFAFGFKGWTYIRLLVVDLNKGEVICNKRGREARKFYRIIS